MTVSFDTTISVNDVPVDAQHTYQFINYSSPPSESLQWGQAWFQAVTLQNDHKPNDGYVKVDYIALIEEDITSGKDTVLNFENYNDNGALTTIEGGLYARFPSWYRNNTFSTMTNSNRSNGILTINVGQQPDSISHFWGKRQLCKTIGKRYKVQISALIHGDIALQSGMDYWLDTITTSGDTLHHKEAFLSKWFGATNEKYDTITYPIYDQLPKFDRSDYGFDKEGRFYISKKLIDYVSGYQVDLYCSANNWAQPLSMTLKGDYYEFYTGVIYDSFQEYYFQVNSTVNPDAQNKFYLPTAIINYIVYKNEDTKLNLTQNGYNFYTNPVDITNNIPPKDDISFTYKLQQNYPNPFNSTTTINYTVQKTSFVTIKVYDILGRVVATLVNEEKTVGNYKVEFNTNRLASGVYFYKMQAAGFVKTKKLILMK